MEYNVSQILPEYHFTVSGVSYIGNPRPHTAMFVTQKVGELLSNLESMSFCLVFVEKGLAVNHHLRKNNCFIFSEHPQCDYARFASILYREWQREEKRKKFTNQDGYFKGENVTIGANAYIEPGCLIGHNVVIGDYSYILSGTVIKQAVIGDNLIANENAVIGAAGFTITVDEYGNKLRIPTLGKVRIGDYVEIGTHDNISCGSGGDTIIEDYVKLDTMVHIGHDAHLGRNVEITAGSIIGGFARLESGVYTGINSSIRNRITLGKNCVVGMGATVTKSVESDLTVAGNPATPFFKD